MKITKKILERIIEEEMKSILAEGHPDIEAINQKLAIGIKAIQEAMAMLQATQKAKPKPRYTRRPDGKPPVIDLDLFD